MSAPDLSLRHPAMLLAIAATAASVLLSAGYLLHDTDLWQLLVVGKAIVTQRSVPATDQWTWVGWGDPQVVSSWAFRALLWPVWSAGGVAGLFALRAVAALATFGLLWFAARRMGARGFAPLVAIALCALAWRLRAELRPESLAAVLLAAQIAILETRRSGGRNLAWAIPLLACAWANLHLSWYLGFLILGFHVIEEWLRTRRVPRQLLVVGLVSAAALFANPYGWRALAQPFEFALRWRHEAMFRDIVELFPVNWSAHRTDGLPVLVAGWPLLAIWRWRRRGIDRVELLCVLVFTAIGIQSQRFLGFYALVAAPFVARDLHDWIASRPWPRWSAGAWARGGIAAAGVLAIGVAEWRRDDLPLGIGVDPRVVPAAAGDFLETNGVRGRAFNHFHLGGYLAWRGWPDRDRLPFVTTQPENIRPSIRARYPEVFRRPQEWHALHREFGFDYVVLSRDQDPGDRLLDVLGADPAWALVFTDDVAQVLVRRGGSAGAVADRFAYDELPAAASARVRLIPAVLGDTARRERLAAELDRAVAASFRHGAALHLRGMLRMMSARWDEARRDLEGARALDPGTPRLSELLGVVALEQGRPRDALREFRRERARDPEASGIELRIGQAHEALGDRAAARRAYESELRRRPDSEAARAALARLAAP